MLRRIAMNCGFVATTVWCAAIWPASNAAYGAEFTLSLQHFLSPEALPHHALIEPWVKRIEAESNGRIKIEIYPEMKLGGKATALVEQVRSGKVDIVWTAAAYTPGAFPRSEVFTLPAVHRGDAVSTNKAVLDLLAGELAEDFSGLHPLLVHVHTGHAVHTAENPLRELADFKGLTLRAPGRGIGRWTVEALGASPTKKRHPKLSRAMEKKAIDGVMMTFQLAEALEVVDAAKYHMTPAQDRYFGTSLYLFLMNPATYAALPPDLKSVIDRNSGEGLAAEAGRIWNDADKATRDRARKRGNEIVEMSGEAGGALETALESVTTRWIAANADKGFDAAKLAESAKQAIARHTDP